MRRRFHNRWPGSRFNPSSGSGRDGPQRQDVRNLKQTPGPSGLGNIQSRLLIISTLSFGAARAHVLLFQIARLPPSLSSLLPAGKPANRAAIPSHLPSQRRRGTQYTLGLSRGNPLHPDGWMVTVPVSLVMDGQGRLGIGANRLGDPTTPSTPLTPLPGASEGAGGKADNLAGRGTNYVHTEGPAVPVSSQGKPTPLAPSREDPEFLPFPTRRPAPSAFPSSKLDDINFGPVCFFYSQTALHFVHQSLFETLRFRLNSGGPLSTPETRYPPAQLGPPLPPQSCRAPTQPPSWDVHPVSAQNLCVYLPPCSRPRALILVTGLFGWLSWCVRTSSARRQGGRGALITFMGMQLSRQVREARHRGNHAGAQTGSSTRGY